MIPIYRTFSRSPKTQQTWMVSPSMTRTTWTDATASEGLCFGSSWGTCCSCDGLGCRFRQYSLSGHPEQYPRSPQTYVPRSEGQECQRWQPERWARVGDTRSRVRSNASHHPRHRKIMVCPIGLTLPLLPPSEYWKPSPKIYPSAILYSDVFILRIIEYGEG